MSMNINTDQKLQLLNSLLIILGWFAVFWFGIRQQRINTTDTAKLKVYEDIWKQRSTLQDSLNQLLVQIQSGPPFVQMESATILGNVTKDPQHISQGQQDALGRLNNYLDVFQNAQFTFSKQFLDFWRSLEMWMHVMSKLETAVKTLSSEYSTVQDKINNLALFVISLDRWNWRAWDRVIIKQKYDNVWQDLFNLGLYIEDLMGLVHNELVSSMFGYTIDYRKPNDSRYKILTKEGLSMVKK